MRQSISSPISTNSDLLADHDPFDGGEVRTRDLPFEQAAVVALGNLQSSMSALFSATPGETKRAADVKRTFGIDAKLAWQAHKIATAKNPMASGTDVPARVSLERLLKAAGRRRVPMAFISRVSNAFNRVETLIDEFAGDRERFESMVGGLIRDEADELDLKYKKAAYRAMTHLRGVDVKLNVCCFIVHPGAEPQTEDGLIARLSVGMQRLRSQASLKVRFGEIRKSENGQDDAYYRMPLSVLPGTDGSFLLSEYCTPGLPEQLRLIGAGTGTPMLEIPGAVGAKNRVTFASAMSYNGSKAFDGPGSTRRFVPTIMLPAEAMITDILLHRDTSPRHHPSPCSVRVYDNHVGDFDDDQGAREQIVNDGLLDVREHCKYLGQGTDGLIIPDSPAYVPMLKSLCLRMNWNPDDFHAYRCRVEYPIFHSCIRIEFDIASKG